MTKFIFGLLCLLTLTSYNKPLSSECDIEAFYKGVTPTEGTKILNSSDDLEDVKLLLIPMDIDKGNYVIKLTRKSSNLYKVENKNIYIVTRICTEFSFNQEVILKVEGGFGYTKGKIIF
jgi:hypothetical protein